MTKCIVFDFDGVLVDSNVIKRDAYFRIFSSVNSSVTVVDECLNSWADGNRYQVIDCILRQLVNRALLPAGTHSAEVVTHYARQYNDICEAYTITCPEIIGVSAWLPQFCQRFSLYIDSTTLEKPLQRVVRERQWEPYFRAVLGSPRTKVENLTLILQQEGIPGSEVIFVGDGMRDLAAARACGCHFIGMRNPFNDFDTQDLVLVDDWYELAQIIAQFEV